MTRQGGPRGFHTSSSWARKRLQYNVVSDRRGSVQGAVGEDTLLRLGVVAEEGGLEGVISSFEHYLGWQGIEPLLRDRQVPGSVFTVRAARRHKPWKRGGRGSCGQAARGPPSFPQMSKHM